MKSRTRTDCQPCDDGVLDRPRYFARQVITAADMTLEQDYFRDKLRRHNRFMHGWGVVCGAVVCPTVDEGTRKAIPWRVTVRPGYILGPYGDEIMIDTDRVVDLKTGGVESRCGDPPGERSDPWCTPATVERTPDQPLYIAVRYKEFSTRPVRVQPVGCGCSESDCQHSRICDGYEISVRTGACPDTHTSSKSNPSLNQRIRDGELAFTSAPVPECPPCPDSPWVYLAEVEVDSNGKVTKIDNCSCRRMVLSFAKSWWECCDPTLECDQIAVYISGDPVDSRRLAPGNQYEVIASGSCFHRGVTPALGDGLQIVPGSVEIHDNGASMSFRVDVDRDAKAGQRDLVLHDDDGGELRCADAITVDPPARR